MSYTLTVNATDYNQLYEWTLESVVYTFHIYWNSRSGWYLSVYNTDTFDESVSESDNALILGGIRLTRNTNLFKRSTSDDLPVGQLWCIDFDDNDNGDTPDLTNFGTSEKFRLVYFTSDEITELGL